MLVLSQDSVPAPVALRNTSAGIGTHETYRRMVKVRAAVGGKVVSGQETVQVLYELDGREVGYEKARLDEAYGAAP